MRFAAVFTLILVAGPGLAAEPEASISSAPAARVLTMEEFLRKAARNDAEFEEILIAELTLRYSEDLRLPARDIVLGVRQDFYVSLDESDKDGRTAASLDKLFPLAGTEISAAYSVTPAASSGDASSELKISLSQPIAENAFGRSTRLLKKIVGLENEVARHQIVEAYEDYFAAVRNIYLDWYEAYERLKIGRSSYQENLKLLENMRQRRKSRIAKSIDVNKIELQVLSKKERLVALEETLASRWNLVKRVLRHGSAEVLVPAPSDPPPLPEGTFEKRFARFRSESRTSRILRLLEKSSSLRVARDADDLLPSISLLLELERDGKEAGFADPESRVLAGFSLELPIRDQVGRAEREVSKIEERKAKLTTDNALHRLRTDILNLGLRMAREAELKRLAEEKIKLAESILKDESENYTYGKASLNDYIGAVNILDGNRFDRIEREVLWRKLHVELLRLTDRLVTEDVESLRGPPAGR